MNRKWFIIAVAPLFASGCFSAMERQGEAWGGGGNRTAAAAADVLTFPVQTPFLLTLAADTPSGNVHPNPKKVAEAENEYNQAMSLLQNDPKLALKERWDRYPIHCRVWVDSFSNPNVKYTQEMIEEIYQNITNNIEIRDNLYHSKACSKEFMVKHFDEELQRCKTVSYGGLANLVSSPNTPLDLVEKVASSKTIPVGAVYPAQHILAQRRAEQLRQPMLNTLSNSP